ncbi:P-II family nitrogen regulator [Chloroflexota bacterium]
MKKIEAIIRYEKLSDVRDSLAKLGYPGITITDVKGHGKDEAPVQQWRGKSYKVELLPKVKLEIVVLDDDVSKMVTAIVRSARTGEVGDGKVFVIPVENAIRVRTGDSAENAI